MAGFVVIANTEGFDARLVQFGLMITQATELLGSARRVVLGEENQRDGMLILERSKRDRIAGFVLGRKVRRVIADLEFHDCLPVAHE